ncbi:MAG: Zn-ribbon domain-containing OB-fold protein [Comamonadaceae bacterium]|uniref:Zn-ribbon domain-containing OB-fold protein n=1 Tax=Hydrogenophaga sp. TaxID=1904254 RepID=UPI000ED1C22E|nr:Zn-ribbon domain-containing OB-fold protein [Hydrogenophaga sp.]MDO9504279.1 Zn-ribbon domain-containing OB-fold protein [Hydrogenophaga sp.]RJP67421.1 MAG: Zn-ribbon domain-containing OB-fold protein [Comamonadaceae bacterium]
MTLPQISVDAQRAYPPRQSGFTQTFWSALADGRWTTTRCKACARQTFPPKPVCPHCWSTEIEWSELGATGILYSWTRIHAAPAVFAAESPYAVGIVDLEDGIRLACRLVERDDLPLTVGQPVEMLVLQYGDGPLFAARPRGNNQLKSGE